MDCHNLQFSSPGVVIVWDSVFFCIPGLGDAVRREPYFGNTPGLGDGVQRDRAVDGHNLQFSTLSVPIVRDFVFWRYPWLRGLGAKGAGSGWPQFAICLFLLFVFIRPPSADFARSNRKYCVLGDRSRCHDI